MHFFRCAFGIVSRSDGHSAAKRSAYQACGSYRGLDGRRYDFTRKAAEHVFGAILLPDAAPAWCADRDILWRRAAEAEKRVDAQEARTLDFSMPRAVPPHLWAACAAHVYEPFRAAGMVLQVDIHDTPATDGGRNINVHGLATLRDVGPDGFGAKNRDWNAWMTRRGGREVRELFAESLNHFCRANGIVYEADPRSNAARDLPKPEQELPRWNFEASSRGETTPAMLDLELHRMRRRAWDAAHREQIEAERRLATLSQEWEEEQERRRRRRAILPAAPRTPDRRAKRLRDWHGSGWVPPELVSAVKSVRYDEIRDCLWIDMQDGSVIVETRDRIELRGEVTAAAVRQMVASAQLAGWTEVEVTGDKVFREAATIALLLKGITVTNHTLKGEALRRYEMLRHATAASYAAVGYRRSAGEPGASAARSDDRSQEGDPSATLDRRPPHPRPPTPSRGRRKSA